MRKRNKKHWVERLPSLACGGIARPGSAKDTCGLLWVHCGASAYRDMAACDPDWYCSNCAKAARLALAAESAPKVDTRTDSDRYVELRKLVEDCQREAMDPASPLVVFDNALRLVLDWRHR